jgi:hypothetical protein
LTWNVPVVAKVHDSVDDPEPDMVVGETVQYVLFVVRLTRPAKPLSAVTLTAEVPAASALTVTVVGLAVVVKSWTVKVMVTEWERKALVPVTPTWTVDTDAKVQDSVALPDPVVLVGESVHDVLFVVRLDVPAKPLTAVTVIEEVPTALTFTLTLVGLAAMVKSWTTNVTVTLWERDPLVPVTDTCLLPVEVNVQANVAVPEPVTLAGVMVHEVVVFVARLTTAPKPSTPVIVIVLVPAAFTFTITVVGLALTVKSWTTKVTVTVWESVELVPVALTWNVPVDVKVQERVEVPAPVTLVGDRVQDVLLVVRLTTPANPLTAATVTVEAPAALTFTFTLVGFASIVKSWTTTVTVTEWDRLALVPLTPTWNVPVEVNVQDRVELPDPVKLVGERVHDVLLLVRLTTPA